MTHEDIRPKYFKHGRANVGISLTACLLLACAQSHGASGQTADDFWSKHPIPQEETATEADAGENLSVGGNEAIRDTDAVDSSVEEDRWNWEKPNRGVIVDDGPDFAPKRGIEIPEAEQPLMGIWVGETRETIACSGSSRVVVELAAGEEAGSSFGFVVFGEAEPPPPATDPEIGYPPEDKDNYVDVQCHLEWPTEGFPYAIMDGRVSDSGRFRFRISALELYESWCALQTSRTSSNSGFGSCLPDMTFEEFLLCNDSLPDPDVVGCPIDSGKFMLCGVFRGGAGGIPCVCTEDGCHANTSRTLLFDLMMDEASMEGLIGNFGFLGEPHPTEVRLRKVR